MMFMKCGYNFLVMEINNIINNKLNYQNQLTSNKQFKGKLDYKIKNKKTSLIKNKKNPPIKIKKKIFSDDATNIQNSSSKRKIKNNIQSSLNLNNKKSKNKNKKTTIPKPDANKNIKLNIKQYRDCELNSFDYTQALLYDKRSCCQYYISLLKSKQHILLAFCPNNDYTSRIIKIDLFILSFDIYYAINFVFFNHEKTIHKVYEDKGKYDKYYFIPFAAISFAIANFIIIIIRIIFLSDSNILEIKKQVNSLIASKISNRVKKNIKIKYFLFFVFSIIFLAFFWLIISSFGALYNNTQVFVFLNALISFGISLIYSIFFNVLPCMFRIISLCSKEKNSETMYKLGKFLQHL